MDKSNCKVFSIFTCQIDLTVFGFDLTLSSQQQKKNIKYLVHWHIPSHKTQQADNISCRVEMDIIVF